MSIIGYDPSKKYNANSEIYSYSTGKNVLLILLCIDVSTCKISRYTLQFIVLKQNGQATHILASFPA